MDMSRPIEVLEVDDVQRAELDRIIRAPTSPQRLVMRARIVLARGQGLSQQQTALEIGVQRTVVSMWNSRFARSGIAGLEDAAGRGHPETISQVARNRVIVDCVRPLPGHTRWTVRTMARHARVSPATVQRLWQANDIKPHVTRTFKLSNDRHFEEKFWDVIGLYLDPPDRALVLCCDEKSQCQALERSQPGLPLGVGHIRTRTHDYIRHGTLTLFAALNYLDGKIISRTAKKHTHRQWLAFLKQIELETPQTLDLHLIVDNYSTHKHPRVKSWLAHHPRVHVHFTPTSSSWMNLVERFFRDLTVDVVRDGSFISTQQLAKAIMTYLSERNLSPRRYVWKKSGAEILASIQRARQALVNETKSGS
jgi:transposase